jgi:hypothetical protein
MDTAGLWCYFARTLAGPDIDLAADLVQFRADADEEYLARFEIPGIRKAGDFRGAGILNTQGRLLVHNAGPDFPIAWVRRSAELAGSTVQIEAARAGEAEVLAWLRGTPAAKAPPAHR